MTDPTFGVVMRRVPEEPRPVIGADLSVIGLIGPAPNADADTFPLDTPVKVYSNDTVMAGKLGTAGYLLDAINGINDQLGDLEQAAQIVVVRTAPGNDADPALALQRTIANVMGASTSGTGVFAFLKATDLLAVTPRVICAPGYTGQMANTVGTLSVDTVGTGYTPGQSYPITFAGGGTSPNIVQATGHAVADDAGEIHQANVFIDSYGGWYSAAPTATLPDPGAGGTTATLTATMVEGANPVCASLPSVLNQLMAHAIIEPSGTNEADDEDWRETLNSQRLIAVTGGCKILDPVSSNIIVRPLAPRIAGIIVRRDYETGAPFHSAANQPVQGIVGPQRMIGFSLTDGDNEGQALLANNVGIIVRGETGSDTAISSGGFIFIGTDNLGDDEVWRFYNVTRGRDYIELSLLRALRLYLGRFNITGHTVQAIINTIGFFLRDLQAAEHILGYKVNFNGSQNSAEQIRQGNLTVAFAAEEPPVLRKITALSARYRPAIDAMVAQLERQLNIAA